MSGISFQGVGSGLPVQQMIDAIMKVKQRPIQIAEKESKNYNTKISDLGKLAGLIESFKSSLDPFRVLKTAFQKQFSVQNSNEDLITVTKKAGYNHKSSTANFKLLDITNPKAKQNWTWSSQKVIADYKYSGTMTMGGQTIDFADKAGGYTLDEMIEKINKDPNLSTKVTAKKVLVNEHTDASKNTYALRIESKIGGQAGALTSPTFTANTITNPNSPGGTTTIGGGSGTGTGTPVTTVNISGGNHIVADSSNLKPVKPSFTIDLTGHTDKTHLTIFFDRDNDGSITDNGGFSNDDEKIVFTKGTGDGVGAFAIQNSYHHTSGVTNLRTLSIKPGTDPNTVVVTVEGLDDDHIKAYNPNNPNIRPQATIGDALSTNRDGYVAGTLTWNPSVTVKTEKQAYSGDTSYTQHNPNTIQPTLKDRWQSSQVANGATITADTKISINSQSFDMKGKTLSQVASAITTTLSGSVTATVARDSGNERLVLTSDVKGPAGVMNVQVTTNNAGGGTGPTQPTVVANPHNDMVVNNSASIMNNLDEKDLQIRFSVNGQVYTRHSYDLDTSKIAGLEGVDVKIKANAGNVANKDATIVTTPDATETKKHTKASVQKFVDSYNKIVEFVNSQTQIEIKGKDRYAGSLQNDSTIKSILQSLDAEIAKATGGDLKQSLAMMGIMHVNPASYVKDKKTGQVIGGGYAHGRINLNAGKLEIKDDLFTKALNNGSLEKTFSGYTDASGKKVEGYADRFEKLSKWMLTGYGSSSDFKGLINMRTDTLKNQQKQLDNRIDNMKLNLREFQARLVKQFNFADTIAAKMSKINATLAKQLGNAGLISSAMGKK